MFTVNTNVVLLCTDMTDGERNKSWYLMKGDKLLIDDGSIHSEYRHDGIHSNQTKHSFYIEFENLKQDYLDEYRCFRETGTASNSLDLMEVKCKDTTAARGDRFINLQCIIKYRGIKCGNNIFWENGNTGETIHTSGGIYEVACEGSENNTIITATLNINKVTDDVLKTNYYMVYDNNHQNTKRYLAVLNQDLMTNNSKQPKRNSVGLVAIIVMVIVMI